VLSSLLWLPVGIAPVNEASPEAPLLGVWAVGVAFENGYGVVIHDTGFERLEGAVPEMVIVVGLEPDALSVGPMIPLELEVRNEGIPGDRLAEFVRGVLPERGDVGELAGLPVGHSVTVAFDIQYGGEVEDSPVLMLRGAVPETESPWEVEKVGFSVGAGVTLEFDFEYGSTLDELPVA
jgi:hypothetical protein